jgi:hypothetical protein
MVDLTKVPSQGSYTTDPTPTYYCTLRFQKYDRPKPFGLTKFQERVKYILPLPYAINDNVVATWTGDNLDVVGDIINGSPISGAASAVYRQLGNITNGLITTGVKAGLAGAVAAKGGSVKGFAGVIKGITGAVDATLPAEGIQNAIEASFGVAPNPNPTLMFKGPRLREFNFRWVFYPKNPTESDNIHKMIRDIKAMMLPSTAITGSAALLKYPFICAINFYPWDDLGNKTDPLLNHSDQSIVLIKRCGVTACNVSYNPGGQSAAFFAGTNKPTVIEMNIGLHEMEYLLADDYDDYHRQAGFFQTLGDLIETGAKNVSWLSGTDAVAAPPDNQPKPNGDRTKQ